MNSVAHGARVILQVTEHVTIVDRVTMIVTPLIIFGVPTHPLDASPKVQILRRLLRQQETVVVVIGQISIG